jgi:hypothetical protein
VIRPDELELELQRSRRFGRPMALVRFRPGAAATEAAARVAGTGRQVDRVWTIGPDILVLLPESGPSQAQAYVARLTRSLPALAEPPRVATFPNDGLTLSALAAELYNGRGDVAGVHAPAAVPPEPRVLHDPAPAADEELAISAARRRAS